MNDEEKLAEQEKIAKRLEQRMRTKDKIPEEQAQRLKEYLLESIKNVEPLGDLHMSITDLFGMISCLQNGLSSEDFQKIMCVISMMYGIEDEQVFSMRLTKTLLTLDPPSDSEPAKP
jgi:hypothetical protein